MRFVKTRVGRRVSHSEAGSSALKLFNMTIRFLPPWSEIVCKTSGERVGDQSTYRKLRRSTATKLMTAETRRERSNCLNRHKLLGGGN